MNTNVLNLNESIDGNRIKQGDKSIMTYVLQDTDNDNLNLIGKSAICYLSDRKGVVYKYVTTVKDDNSVDFVITDVIQKGLYTLEIVVDNKYVFPSDLKTRVEVTESVLGQNVTEFKKVTNFEELIELGIKNHKFDDYIEEKVFEKENGQIYLLDVALDDLPNIKVPFVINHKYIFNNVSKDASDPEDYVKSGIRSMLDYGFYTFKFADGTEDKTEPHLKELYQSKERNSLQNTTYFPITDKYQFPFQITRYENDVVVKQQTCQNTFDLSIDDYLSYIAEGGRVEVKYIYKDKPIDFGKYDSENPPKYTGGGYIKPDS